MKNTLKNLHNSLEFRIFDTAEAFSVQRNLTTKQPKKYDRKIHFGGEKSFGMDFLWFYYKSKKAKKKVIKNFVKVINIEKITLTK